MHPARKGESFAFSFYSAKANSILASEKCHWEQNCPRGYKQMTLVGCHSCDFWALSKAAQCLQFSEGNSATCVSCKDVETSPGIFSDRQISSLIPALHYIASLDYISLLPLEEVLLTCLKRLENSRIKFLRDCLKQRHHLWLPKFITWECTAGGVSWMNIPACTLVVWLLSQRQN